MLATVRNSLKSAFFKGAFLLLLVLYLYLGIAELSGESRFTINDKVAHALAYFVLMAWGLFAFPAKKHTLKLFVFCIAYSFLIELIQYFIPYRSFSLADMLANTLGCGLAYCLIPTRLVFKDKS